MDRNQLVLTKDLDLKKLPKLTRLLISAFGLCSMLGISLLWTKLYDIDSATFKLIGLIAMVPVTVLHELFHGLGFAVQKYPVKFGIVLNSGLGLAFFTTSPGSILPKSRMLPILLAPQLLTIASLALSVILISHHNLSGMLVAFASYNFGGGCADMYTFMLLLKSGKETYVEDTGTGGFIYRKI